MKKKLNILLIVFFVSCERFEEKYKDPSSKSNFDYTDTFKYYVDNCIHQFYGFSDFDKALICAKREKKNMLTIFSGRNLSCNGLEWRALGLFNDNNFIQNKFVIVWLPVNDRELLDDTTKIETINNYTYQIKTIGDRNAIFEIKLLSNNSQPISCFIDTNIRTYGNILSYTSDVVEVKAFIESGLTK